jgi:glutamate synthase (NADPH/NADH) small chain
MLCAMQQFHKIVQSYPALRDADQRSTDFDEIYAEFAASKAAEQASRCLQCGVPFCQVHCPLHNNIPDWLRLTAEGRLREAYDTVAATNTFPEICGRICPQDRLCEGNCVVNAGFGAITIGSVEKYITETAFREGWVEPFTPAHERGESVGIIGAGPAGLAAGEMLRRQGFSVTIYDRHDRVGGLMMYGIPNFKLDKQVMLRRAAQYAASGITFELNTAIGVDITFDDLRAKHDAILIATGVYRPRALDGLHGLDLGGLVPALEYLTASNKIGLGDSVPDAPNAHGKRVVVVGGGDTAMDCVRTAVRQGATSVTCLYRRDRENMPGSAREVTHAEAEGVMFEWMRVPQAFLGDTQVREIKVGRMQLGPADAKGRRTPEPVAGESVVIQADMVIKALGFDPEDIPAMFGAPALRTNKHGCLHVNAKGATALPGVFAAGDIVRGASLVVWAIADGRMAAKHIMHYIEQRAKAAA